ncbi:MAG: HAMP domain-containing protein [Bryobacterales bacterium]|nr:HAMP domain-containing protein [Bryobacterales bacterium]MBV9398275.1 HAMP domain-containing protein [Bryobacterales bacterium]
MSLLAPLSTRSRLMLWSTGALLLSLLIFGFEVYSVLQNDLLRDVDRRLYAKANGVKTVLELENVSGPALDLELSEFSKEIPEGNLLQLSTDSGELIWPRQSPFVGTDISMGLSTSGTRRILLMPFDYEGRRYQVVAGASLDDVNRIMGRLRAIMWATGAPMLLIAGWGGYWLSRRAMAPVDAMTTAAQSIRLESLSRRLPVPNTGDELERLARVWNELLERLETSVKRIRQFTADASHELRTPIALIRATAELALRRERGPADYRKALAEIEAEAGRMTELVESMLSVARADSSARMPLAALDVSSLAADVVSQTEILAAGKGVELQHANGATRVIAEANEAGLRRLLRILLDNALEHTPAGGKVTVSVWQRNGSVDLSVRDTGEGIPAPALPHIFERFYRGDPARGGKGAGLGLSIAQAIAQAHGTKIEVESKLGEGSCFRVALRGA